MTYTEFHLVALKKKKKKPGGRKKRIKHAYQMVINLISRKKEKK